MKRISRRRLLGAGTASLGVVVAGCSGGDGDGEDGDRDGDAGETTTTEHQGSVYTVNMTEDLEFFPESITATPGDKIVWKNDTDVAHSVTAYGDQLPDDAEYFASGGFDSESAARDVWPDGQIAAGEEYENVFEQEGAHEYFCIPHEDQGMTGTVRTTTF